MAALISYGGSGDTTNDTVSANDIIQGPNVPNAGVQVLPLGVSTSDVAIWISGLLILALVGWQLSIHTSSGHTFLFLIILLIVFININRVVAITNKIASGGGL